jgi:uncharacterized protein DUF5916/cellulose/xylan binding protein with CBM9 domain
LTQAECAATVIAVRLVPVFLLFAAVPALAQQAAPGARAQRIAEGPVIDGRLDEAAWKDAPEIGGFRQKEPEEGAPASEPTTVRVLYDASSLYIGVQLTDSRPAEVRASELRRDNPLENDDTFAVLLDTYHDHRNAFLFRINARGTRFDALVRNESRYLSTDWDEQWTAAAAIGEQGWSAEIAIPFKILRFSGASEQNWGLNFERVIKRANEFTYWAGWDRDFDFTHVSQAGHLAGLREIRQAERLRLRPYAIAGADRLEAVAAPRGTDGRVEVGIDDLKYAVTPNLTSDLAVNPDFAQTEVDQQQVNLTRFSLFFPEKRQFFVEGADSLRMGVGLLHFGPPPLELFYSRAVGLSEIGEPIPLLAGGKLTGKVSGFDVGFINAQTDGNAERAGENFGVARVRKEVLARSYVGAMVTNRQSGGSFNRVAAIDARFVLKRYFNVGGLAARSFDSRRSGRQWAKQLGAEWRDDLVEAGVNYIDVDPAFEPGIGFVRRHDRLLGTRVSLKPRPGIRGIRQLELTPSAVYYHDDSGTLVSREARFQFATALQSGDRVELEVGNTVERLVRPFRISQFVSVNPGRYEWNYAAATLRSFNGRAASGSVTVNVGDFYSGTKRTLQMAGDFRPSKNLSFNPTYTFNDIDLREGAFDTHLFGLRANVSFTTNVLTSAFLQYNSAGELAALQVRLNYIFRTIDNIYLVLNETRFTSGVFDGRSNRSFVVKTTYSIHR